MKKSMLIVAMCLAWSLSAADKKREPKAEVVSTTKKGDTITISQPKDHPWKIREEVCVSRGSKELACGKVVLSTPTEATVKLKPVDKKKKAKKLAKKELPKKGDVIRLAPTPVKKVVEKKPKVPVVVKKEEPVKEEALKEEPVKEEAVAETKPAEETKPEESVVAEKSVEETPAVEEEKPPAEEAKPKVESKATKKDSKAVAKKKEKEKKDKKSAKKAEKKPVVVAKAKVPPTPPAEEVEEKEEEPEAEEEGDRSPASEGYSIFTKRKYFNIGLGLGGGFSYFLPLARVQFAPTRRTAIGITPVYLSTTSNGTAQKATGGLLTYDHSLGRGPFLGFYAQAAAGVYWLTATKNGLTEEASRPTFAGSLGYRAVSKFGLNLGIQVGAQYVLQSSTLRLIEFQGFLPLVIADITFSF